jgi:hypothetical protein
MMGVYINLYEFGLSGSLVNINRCKTLPHDYDLYIHGTEFHALFLLFHTPQQIQLRPRLRRFNHRKSLTSTG